MRRIAAAFAALMILITLSCVPAAAGAGRLSLAYVPRTERGTVFFLDVSYDGTLSAAMLELDYDRALAEYREVTAAADTTSVKAQSDAGKVRIVLGDSDRISGRLCRLSFKALGSGDAAFTLRMTEGVGGDLQQLELPPECSLNVSLSTGGASGSGPSSSGRSSAGKSYAGSGSTRTRAKSADSDTAADGEAPQRTVRDLRVDKPDHKTLIILGIAAGTCAVLLAVFGFMLGRKSRKKKQPDGENGGE